MDRKLSTVSAHVATAASLLLCSVAPAVRAQSTQGVSKDEIVIGTIQDLSAPVAAYCKAASMAAISG